MRPSKTLSASSAGIGGRESADFEGPSMALVGMELVAQTDDFAYNPNTLHASDSRIRKPLGKTCVDSAP